MQMTKSRIAHTSAVAIVLAGVVAACGGDSPQSAAPAQPASGSSVATQPATAATSTAPTAPTAPMASPAADKANATNGWATDVCGIVERGALAETIGTPISGAASPATQKSVCEYSGAFPGGEVATAVRLQYFKDRSEWDIRAGNLGIKDRDKLPGLGADAFKSADGIWVLLPDGRMFIADVAYGISDESAKELAVTRQILALSSPEGAAQAGAATSTSATPAAAAPSATTAALAVDACALITPAEAEAAIGGKVGAAKPGAGGTSCSYNEDPFALDGGLLSVTVFAENTISYQTLHAQFTNQQPLSGVGEEGFIAHIPDSAGANAGFRVGRNVVMISFGAKGPTSAIPGKVKALAAAAAGRL